MRLTPEEYKRRFPDRPAPIPAKFRGEWVAWNEDCTMIVAHGQNLAKVVEQASAAGYDEPALQKIPASTFVGCA